jgi:Protein of unknown function (DUF1573)
MKRLFCLLLFFATAGYGQQLEPLRFLEEIHDFGYVDQDAGPATYSFQFFNTSSRPIKILSVQASCGCTTPDWTRDPVASGASGFIEASFNPKGRPGYFNKSLTVTTDFDSNPIILQIKGQVSSGSGLPAEREFRSSVGSFRLKTSSLNMGKVLLKDEFEAKEFPVLNGGSSPVTFLKMEGPAYIKVELIPSTIQPGDQGKIRILYNGKIKGQYGFQSDQIDIRTDDVEEPVKSFSVYATLEEYFPELSREQLLKAPALQIAQSAFDLGNIKQYQEASYELVLTNTGKSRLIIRAIQGNCSCITTSAAKDELRTGGQTTVTIKFNPEDRLGTQQKSVTIYSNDPQNPVQRVTFTAYVED